MTETAAPPPVKIRVNRDNPVLRLLIIAVVIFAGFSLALPGKFLSLQNLQSMANQFPEFGILVLAIMITMISGGIDLSVVATANLSGLVAGLVLTTMAPDGSSPVGIVLLALLAALIVGSVCGLVNGVLVSRLGIAPMLATLGTSSLYTGLAYVMTGGPAIRTNQMAWLGTGDLFGIPYIVIIFAILAAVVAVMLNRSPYGFKLYMLGTNATASRFSGIPNLRVLMRTYWLSGLLAGVAGMVFLSRANSAKPDYGAAFVLLSVLIVILGGVSYTGGFGRMSGVILAILSMQFLSTGLNMLMLELTGSSAAIFFRQFAWGALLLVVMVINYYSIQRQNRVTTTQ